MISLPRNTWLHLAIVAALTALAAPATNAAVPDNAEPSYMKRSNIVFDQILPAPPAHGSAEQAADMAEVVAIAHAATSNDVLAAFSEKKFSAVTFAPAIGDFFQSGRFPKTEAFLDRVKIDANIEEDAAKEVWRRPRPFTVNPSLATGQLEKSFSYPSGHSTEAGVLALVLCELFPKQRDGIMAIGRGIGWHRVQIGRHYPTDIYAGRVLALAIVREMKTNAAFRKDLAEAKKEIATIHLAGEQHPHATDAAARN